MKKNYVEIYEVVWREATRIGDKAWCSKQFQRIFFTSKAAQEFRKKLLDEGLNPDYTRLDIHKLPVLSEEIIFREDQPQKTAPPEKPNSRTPGALMTGGDNA
jgi:hypothetical protein